MFKIRIVAQESAKSRPIIITEEYVGADPDIFVRDLLRNLIFHHGFRRIRVSVVLVTSQFSRTEKNITVQFDGLRR